MVPANQNHFGGEDIVVLMLAAECTLVLELRGMSIRQYLASRDPVSGTVYYVVLGVFAVMPLMVGRR